MRSDCVLVVGHVRSGVNLITGILHHLGVPVGINHITKDEWYPSGDFEDKEFIISHNKRNDQEYEQIMSQKCNQSLWGLNAISLLKTFDYFKKYCTSNIKFIF